MGAEQGRQFTYLAVTEEKPYDRAYGAREMHPFWYLRYHLSPGGGKVVCIELLMRPKAERRANFPLRGKWCAAPKGVHFHRAKPGCTVFHSAERNYKTHRPQGDTTTLSHEVAVKPKNPPAPGAGQT